VLYEVEEIGLDKLDTSIHEWIQSHGGKEGVFVGRIPKSYRIEEYYVYINKRGAYTIEISNGNVPSDSLKVDVNALSNTYESSLYRTYLYRLTTINKRAKRFFINETIVKVSSIREIKINNK
jgi:hypothetical protein